MKKTVITVGSVTFAQKARRLLSGVRIPSKLIKIDSTLLREGCTHGIEIFERDFLDAARILRENGIAYSIYEGYGRK